MTAQVLVIAVGAVTLLVTALLVAPPLFHTHLVHSGESNPRVQQHAEEAFAASFAIALAVGAACALAAAGIVSWYLVRRVADPIVALADAADSVAGGDYEVHVPPGGFATEVQRLSEAFGRMATRLADTDASRRRLMADVAHEIRTPLSTLEAYVDGMEDGVVPLAAESWATMRGQVRRLRRLTDELRDVAAAEEHALTLVLADLDLAEVAADAVAGAAPRYQAKQVALRLHRDTVPTTVTGDRERLGQVVANLLDNALRHTPPGGGVDVRVTSEPGAARLTVDDTGEGIPPDQLDAIFERFRRVDPARTAGDGGSGLGLTIARAIVAEHGGTLTAHSAGPSRGATLTVALPA
jgi:signal transduction histidine kinase